MIALPPLMALGGATLFAGTAYATLAASAGWMIGSWIYNRNNQEDSADTFDPGAEEMPRFNQALRGITIPVLFGTNKVSSQVIGQWNFNAIREESSSGGGGGKSGGSGGKMGTQQQSTLSYRYQWDLIYHLGMTHERLFLYGGWLGVTKLTDDTIIAISKSQASFGSLSSTDSDQPPKEVDLQFDDGFYNDGAYGDDIGVDDVIWNHVEDSSVIGAEIRWPGTVWVGFEQLLLGSMPRVPQLSFEVGPGVGDLIQSDGFQWYDPSIAGNDGVLMGNGFDKNGSVYNQHTLTHVSELDGNGFIITAKTLINNWYADNGGPTIVNGSERYIGPILGGQYLLVSFEESTTPLAVHIAICDINIGAQPTVLGVVWFNRDSSTAESISNIFICGNQTIDDPIILAQKRGFFILEYTLIPSINDIINGTFVSGGWGPTFYNTSSNVATWDNHEVPYFSYRLDPISGLNWAVGGGNVQSRRLTTGETDWGHFHNSFGFAIPKGIIGIDPITLKPTLTYQTRVWYYFNKSVMESHRLATVEDPIAEITSTVQPAQPNGALGYFDFGQMNYIDHQPQSTGVTKNVDDFRLTTWDILPDANWEDFPFTDEMLESDGITASKNSYEMKPSVEKHDSGGYVVLFHMNHVNDNDQQITSVKPDHQLTAIRGYIWNPFLETATLIGKFVGPSLVSADAVVPADDTLWNSRSSLTWRNPDTGDIYWGGTESNDRPAPGASPDNDSSYVVRIGQLIVGTGDDITPPEIIFNILTNEIYGLGILPADINTTAYEDAIAYCYAQNFKVSTQYRREASNILTFISHLLELYGGFLTVSQEQIKFGILEFTTSPVRTIDNHHLIKDSDVPPVAVTEGAHQDTVNRAVINFIDRSLDYLQNQIIADDEADQEQYGVRKAEFPPQFVMPEDMATTLAWRSLYTNLYTRDTFSFKLGIKDADLEPGDVITLVDSHHTYLQSGVEARITTWREVSNGIFDVTAREELEYTMVHSQSPLDISSLNANSGAIDSLARPDYQVMYELPCIYQSSDQGVLYGAYITKVGRPFGATVYISADGVSFGVGDSTSPYPLGGKLLTSLPASAPGTFQENIEVLMFPDSAWTVNSPVYTFNETLPAASPATRAAGGALIYIGSEMLAYEGVNLVAQNRYRLDRVYRGWGGTHIHNHNSGDFWHKHGSGVFSQIFSDDRIGNKVQYKIAPVRFNGTEYNVASVDASCYTIVGRHYTPQNAPQPRYIANSVDFRGRTLINVGSDGNIDIDWRDSARKNGYGNKGYGIGDGGYGRFVTDVASTQWRVEVVGSDDVIVRSISTGSPGYSYTNSLNFEDNGAWRGNVAFKITPYNSNGIAPRVSVVSLELFI